MRHGYVLVTVIYQGHLALEVVDVALQTLPGFHLDREELVTVPLKFPPRSKLVEKCISHVMKVPELVPRERVKPVVGDSLEAGWERSAEEKIVVSVNCHFVLILAEMLEGVRGSRVVVEVSIRISSGSRA